MTQHVDHPRPCMPLGADSAVVTVDLTAFGMAGRYERLAVAPSPAGGFVVACLPFFTYGIQFGDLIAATEPGRMFERVVKQSGLRTLRLAFVERSDADERHEAIHGRLLASGLSHEWHGAAYASVLLRDFSDQSTVLDCVADELRRGAISWEVDPEEFLPPTVR